MAMKRFSRVYLIIGLQCGGLRVSYRLNLWLLLGGLYAFVQAALKFGWIAAG